jgi:hypothetical protein
VHGRPDLSLPRCPCCRVVAVIDLKFTLNIKAAIESGLYFSFLTIFQLYLNDHVVQE